MRASMILRRVLPAAFLVALASPPAGADQKFKVVNLSGAYTGSANGINAGGQIAGQYTISGNVHAFRWDPSAPNGATGTLVDLHPGGAVWSHAIGINSTGQIAGDYVDGSSQYHPVRTSAMSAINLPGDDLGGGSLFGIAYAVNDSGVVVGYAGGRAFRTSGSAVGSSDYVGPSAGTSKALGINASGTAVGQMPSTGTTHAARAASGSAFADLMGGGGGFGTLLANSYATCVNTSGQVAGYVSVDDEGLIFHAYRTTAGGLVDNTATDLGTLGGSSSYAEAINSSGMVVGWSLTASSDSHGFVYDSTGMHDLNTMLDAGSAGWVITAAYGINDAGQIVGYGVEPGTGQQRAILLTSPETFAITSVSPNPVRVGSGSFTLTVNGGAFTNSSYVVWKKTKLTTHFQNSTQLTADVPGSLIARTGSPLVYVVNPGPVNSNQVKVAILPYLKSVKVTPGSPYGGNTATGVVSFNFPAPAGAVVTLSSDNPAVASPDAAVTVPEGSLASSPFDVTTTPVSVDTPLKISAVYAGVTRKGGVKVKPPALLSLAFDPATVQGGAQDSIGTITLTGPAPKGGTLVSLTSNKGDLTVPVSVTVLEGSRAATFTATSHPVAKSSNVTVRATLDGLKFKSGRVTVTP